MLGARYTTALFVLALLALLVWRVETTQPGVFAPAALGAFQGVVNADTLRFANGRLLIRGIDGPDAPQCYCIEERAAAPIAREFVHELIRSSRVEITNVAGGGGPGASHRIGDATVDGQSLADILVNRGVAVVSPNNARNWCAVLHPSSPPC